VQVCCSGLNAPLPFANAQKGDYDWDIEFSLRLRAHGADVGMRGVQQLLTDHTRHFVRMDIDAGNHFDLTVQAYDARSLKVGRPFSTHWQHPLAPDGGRGAQG